MNVYANEKIDVSNDDKFVHFFCSIFLFDLNDSNSKIELFKFFNRRSNDDKNISLFDVVNSKFRKRSKMKKI